MNWIPVKERLPNHTEDVLVSINSYHPHYNRELVKRFMDISKYLNGTWIATFGACEQIVTHWAELPPLPEESI